MKTGQDLPLKGVFPVFDIQLNPEVLEQCREEGIAAVQEARRMRVLRQKAYRYDKLCLWRSIILTLLGSFLFISFIGYVGNI